MENALLIGLSRQTALERQLDVVANNIANVNTSGYKADKTLFEEYLNTPARMKIISSVATAASASCRTAATYRDMSQGPVEATNNPLDVAINGSAFLAVQAPAASATPVTATCRSTTRASS